MLVQDHLPAVIATWSCTSVASPITSEFAGGDRRVADCRLVDICQKGTQALALQTVAAAVVVEVAAAVAVALALTPAVRSPIGDQPWLLNAVAALNQALLAQLLP